MGDYFKDISIGGVFFMSGSVRYKCPSCKAFLSLAPFIERFTDWVMCRSCGHRVHVPSAFDVPGFALASGTRRDETGVDQDEVKRSPSRRLVQGEAFQSGPKGNAQSNLLPNGKIKRSKEKPSDSRQLDLFGGAL